jgi:branched-chain amino acid aminotransferase
MPEISEEMFIESIHKVVKANAKYVPPYGTGASLYIRPFVIGTAARVGLGPADEYVFCVMVTPVGPYYKGGFKPVNALVIEEYDRAAPLGVVLKAVRLVKIRDFLLYSILIQLRKNM